MSELENILTELFQTGTSYDPEVHKAPYIDIAKREVESRYMPKSNFQEIRDRIDYFYLQTDGTYKFPNSAEGDLLKMVHNQLNFVNSIQQKEQQK